MGDSAVFEWACGELESTTVLNRAQARGTLRLALKQSGLDGATLTGPQLRVVAERVLPGELRLRGVKELDRVCRRLQSCPDSIQTAAGTSPETVFTRLGGQS